MGGSSSKEKPLYIPPPPKEGEIKIDKANLPKLDLVNLNVAKPPPIKTGKDLKREAEREAIKGMVDFDLGREFDQETYIGRFQLQASRLNPLLFFNSNTTIKQAHEKVTKYKMRLEVAKRIGQGVLMKPEEIEEIKKASRIAGGAVHPDTNKIIPFYQRLSGFVVFNAPIVFIVMFTPNQTPLFNAGMQWVNQTYNSGMNYGNRNASSEYTTSDLARGYSAAVVTSVSIALISRTLMAKQLASLKGPRLILTNAFLNWMAAAFAGFANCALMRQKELFEGISVYNKDGTVCYGKSVQAGKQALLQTGISRVILPFPVLFFPALVNCGLLKIGLWPKNTTLAKLTELTLCVLSLSVALPGSVALFKQQSMLTRDKIDIELQKTTVERKDPFSAAYITPEISIKPEAGLEEKLSDVKAVESDQKVEYVQEFYFNKGL